MTCSPRPCSLDACSGRVVGLEMCSKHYKRYKRWGDPLAGRIADGETARYFYASISLPDDECRLWPYTLSEGYGMATIDGRLERVHVLACEYAHGPRPHKHDAAHSCGNRACFNPRHLRWATRAENAADRNIHGTNPQGERCPTSKLTASQVRGIRLLLAVGTSHSAIARRFGVSRPTISDIANGRSWRSVA